MLKTVITVIIFLIAGCGEKNLIEASSENERATTKIKDYLLEKVASEFKDPNSAQYRNVSHYLTKAVFANGQTAILADAVCGEVNGKNSYGGYVGYKSFVVISNLRTSVILKSEENTFVFIDDRVVTHKYFMEAKTKNCLDQTKHL